MQLKLPLSEEKNALRFPLLKGKKSCLEACDVVGLLQRLDFREDLLEQVSVVGTLRCQHKKFKLRCASLGVRVGEFCGLLGFHSLMV
jgi:hypothetical protein